MDGIAANEGGVAHDPLRRARDHESSEESHSSFGGIAAPSGSCL
jgi:hypothetical protein